MIVWLMINGNSLGDARPVERYRTSTVEYIDDGGKPFLTYEFRYRSIRQYISLRLGDT